MKKTILMTTLAAGSVPLAVASALDVSARLQAFAEALSSAQGLTVTYTLQPLGGSPAEVKVAFAKPDKARIETASQIVVADGASVTVFEKASNSYYKVDQTMAEVMKHLEAPDRALWRGFFGGPSPIVSAQDSGTRKRGGRELAVVRAQADARGESTMTLYFDVQDGLLRQGEFVAKELAGETRSVLNVTDLRVEAAPELFTFKAPDGAKQIDAASLLAGKWFADFEEARKVARATGKLMLVDFYAVWCGPCKRMKAEAFEHPAFKEKAKDFVLVMIDAEKQAPLARRYNVEGYPTVKFIDKDGKVVHEFVGYGGVEQVLADMDRARARG